MATEEYRFSEEHFRRLRRSVLIAAIVTMVVVVAVTMFTTRRNGGDQTVTIAVLVLMTVVIGFSMYRGDQRQQAQARSFRITITGDTLQRTADGFEPVTIRAGDVRSVRWTPGRALVIKGSEMVTLLTIPETLERFADLRRSLEGWCPVEEGRRPHLLVRWRWPAMIVTLAAMGAVFLSDSPAVVLPVGIALVLAMIISLSVTLSSPDVDKRTKRLSWVALLVVAQIVGRIVLVVRAARLF